MPRDRRFLRTAVLLMALSGAAALEGAPAAQEPASGSGRPGPAEIARAIDLVKADPNLATERTVKTLRWKRSAGKAQARRDNPFFAWIRGLFAWLDQSARLLVWGAAAVLAVLVAVYAVQIVRRYGAASADHPFVAPTHVRDLDIRPETLPPDIGAAARALWDRGEHRAALALLYRGMLSRLAHVHGVPIRDSSTEGDCLALAAGHLTATRRDYATGLVRIWQRAVYGREDVPTDAVHGLCDGFGAALDPASPARAHEARA